MELLSVQGLVVLAIVIAVFATVVAIFWPMLQGDKLGSRMKTVALERAEIRARERAAMKVKGEQGSLRDRSTGRAADIAERFDLRARLADGDTGLKLKRAGLRGQNALNKFLVARLTLPFVMLLFGALYVFGLGVLGEQPIGVKLLVVLAATAVGYYLPGIYVANLASKRKQSITKAWPDALDLALICVESGMSVEAAFRKVSEEIGMQSVELAEELVLTTAELSFLPERRQAYENLVDRTGVEAVKSVTQALQQAEKYGTPVGQALRVLASESRAERMNAAEKKAHALPPKLTVPMIIFFVPVLFIVVLGPPIMTAMDNF